MDLLGECVVQQLGVVVLPCESPRQVGQVLRLKSAPVCNLSVALADDAPFKNAAAAAAAATMLAAVFVAAATDVAVAATAATVDHSPVVASAVIVVFLAEELECSACKGIGEQGRAEVASSRKGPRDSTQICVLQGRSLQTRFSQDSCEASTLNT